MNIYEYLFPLNKNLNDICIQNICGMPIQPCEQSKSHIKFASPNLVLQPAACAFRTYVPRSLKAIVDHSSPEEHVAFQQGRTWVAKG